MLLSCVFRDSPDEDALVESEELLSPVACFLVVLRSALLEAVLSTLESSLDKLSAPERKTEPPPPLDEPDSTEEEVPTDDVFVDVLSAAIDPTAVDGATSAFFVVFFFFFPPGLSM